MNTGGKGSKEGTRKAVEYMEHEGEKSTTGRGTNVGGHRHVGEVQEGGAAKTKLA